MNQQRADRFSQTPRRSSRIKGLLSMSMAFAAGAVFMYASSSISRKTELMSHPYQIGRLMELASVVRRSLGFGHLRSCETKVERLHEILVSPAPNGGAKADEVADYVASIIIDGRDCNEYLIQHLDSDVQLPAIRVFDEFRSIYIHDTDLGPLLENEQGLVLFLLYRINPEILLFSPEYFYGCEETTEEGRRSFLVSEWKSLYGKGAPPGVFRKFLKRFSG